MRVVLNLIPVQSGGGLQQAVNLLTFLADLDESTRACWLILVSKNGPLHKWLEKKSILKFEAFKYDYINYFLIGRKSILKSVNRFSPDIVFHFTATWRGVEVPQVVRSVYSNLYFPEIEFWSRRPFLSFLRKKIIDWFRLRGTLRADGLIFENRAMQQRSHELFSYPIDRTRYIKPSSANYVPGDLRLVDRGKRAGAFTILYLSSWYRNKNIHILPDVAAILHNRGIPVRFRLSLDRNHPEVARDIIAKSGALGVEDYFELLGTIPPSEVPSYIMSSDSMILLSKLECFSSNIVEAWTFKRPLIVSNEDWATSECADAALYVDRSDCGSIADGIAKLAADPELCDDLVTRGTLKLLELNTPEEKGRQQMEFLEKIWRAGKKD